MDALLYLIPLGLGLGLAGGFLIVSHHRAWRCEQRDAVLLARLNATRAQARRRAMPMTLNHDTVHR